MKPLLLLLLTLLSGLCLDAQEKNFIDQPFVEVGGTADTLVVPNEIYIRIIISEKDTRDRISVEEQEEKMLLMLKGLGVDTQKDLSTNDMLSNFKSYLLKGKDIIKAKIYTLKVSDADIAGKVFVKLEEMDISNTSIERVAYSDYSQLQNLMRARAIVNARERARILVQPLNQHIGLAIHVVDREGETAGYLEGRALGIQIRGNSSLNRDRNEILPKIQFEKIKVTANVRAKFKLE